MKKMRAIENIRIEETLYKPGEEFEIAEEETKRLIDLAISDDGGKDHENDRNDNLWKTFYHIVENMKVPTINSLNINGYDLMELGIYNKEIQKVKKYLLNELLEGNIENFKEELIEKVKEYILKN